MLTTKSLVLTTSNLFNYVKAKQANNEFSKLLFNLYLTHLDEFIDCLLFLNKTIKKEIPQTGLLNTL